MSANWITTLVNHRSLIYMMLRTKFNGLERKVELKSGGYLIIRQTEAMTIDINTGAFVGHRNLEETIFNTNVRLQRRLPSAAYRSTGGIIIIRFSSMCPKQIIVVAYCKSLEQALAKDRAKTGVNGFSQLGLVEMTRKRTRESLEHVLCSNVQM